MSPRAWFLAVAMLGLGVVGWASGRALFAVAGDVVIYHDAGCGCCEAWTQHMRDNGFRVTVRFANPLQVQDLRARLRVPRDIDSCHIAVLRDRYVVGHVPSALVKEALVDPTSSFAGLAVVGMPVGSPGMEIQGTASEAFNVLAVDGGGTVSIYRSIPAGR